MTRVLTATRVAVAADDTRAWLATLRVLSQRLAARGQHLWVFRNESEPGEWLEFTEGKDETTHRSHGPADDDERTLEARLRSLARYDAGTAARWHEVELGDT